MDHTSFIPCWKKALGSVCFRRLIRSKIVFSSKPSDILELTCLFSRAQVAAMADAVRASRMETQRMCVRSQNIWSSSFEEVNPEASLPLECVQLRTVLGRVQAFQLSHSIKNNMLTQLKVKHRKLRSRRFELFITGRST